ncbi:hypothetical protein [Micromonospora chersina]|uniref:hypothetical protein n=1 Tax=Micromonospora chersina TaxID=47854 RepID=UPI0033A0FAB3
MRIKRSAAAAAFLAIVASGSLVAAPPAFADSGVCNGDRSACVEFKSYGEWWTIHDYEANSRATLVRVDLYAQGSGGYGIVDEVYWNTNGYSGPAREVNADYSPEGWPLRYMACEGNYSTKEVFNCSGWQYDNA